VFALDKAHTSARAGRLLFTSRGRICSNVVSISTAPHYLDHRQRPRRNVIPFILKWTTITVMLSSEPSENA
jgi:hypothetical protein